MCVCVHVGGGGWNLAFYATQSLRKFNASFKIKIYNLWMNEYYEWVLWMSTRTFECTEGTKYI